MFRDGKSIFASRGLVRRGATVGMKRFEKKGRRKWVRRLAREHTSEQLAT